MQPAPSGLQKEPEKAEVQDYLSLEKKNFGVNLEHMVGSSAVDLSGRHPAALYLC